MVGVGDTGCLCIVCLPYKLIKNDKYIDTENQYLLSTKELNTTTRFEELLKSNISSFKIEGRMKSPAYVGYITKIYRNLINKYNEGKKIELTDEEQDNLKILFNREFTEGYLFNNRIMNIKSSNHQGLEVGKVLEVTPKKIKIKLTKPLYQEDGIRFKNNNLGMIVNMMYNDKDLLINKAIPGDIIYLDNKINLKNKDILVKTSSNYLEKEILNIPEKKIKIDINVKNDIIEFIDDKNNRVVSKIEVMPALNRPTTKEEIEEKITKLGNTPFAVNNINIDIKDNIFISMKTLNETRRLLTEELIKERTKITRINNSYKEEKEYIEEKDYNYEISVLARTKNQVEAALDSNVDRIYVDEELYNEYKEKNNIYLRLPRVVDNYNYQSKNILITELGALNAYQEKNINIVSDYYLNVVNNHSIKYLLNNGVKRVTLSPEINYDNLEDFIKDKIEVIVYGRLELMLTKSCPISEVLNNCPCNSR